MIDDDHSGIANVLNLPVRNPVRAPKVYTQVTPELTSEVLMRMTPLNLPKSETKVERVATTTRDTPKDLIKYGAENSSKKIGTAPQGSKQQKLDMDKHVKDTLAKYENEGVKYVGTRSDNPSWMKDLEKTGPYGKNKRFVNKSLNSIQNSTANKSVVTFNPTTQLFTDGTRNIAFKSYNDAKRWNDAVNKQPTATPDQVNGLANRIKDSRKFGYNPEDVRTNRKKNETSTSNQHRRLR